MKDPTRWSSPGSEVDPVLRSVFRYAQGLGPSASETQSLLRRVEASERERDGLGKARFAARPRFGTIKAAVLAAAFGAALGSVAFAGYAVHQARVEAASSLAGSRQPEPRPGRFARSRPKLSAEPVPSAEPAALAAPAAEPRQPVKAREPSRAAGAQSGSRPARAASLQSEAELLQSARARLSSDPEDALRQTRAHAARFPASVLGEERSALEIEALLRLGRAAEAEGALSSFEAQHPRSPYRRRLRALLP